MEVTGLGIVDPLPDDDDDVLDAGLLAVTSPEPGEHSHELRAEQQ